MRCRLVVLPTALTLCKNWRLPDERFCRDSPQHLKVLRSNVDRGTFCWPIAANLKLFEVVEAS